jgi:hypothetical protein
LSRFFKELPEPLLQAKSMPQIEHRARWSCEIRKQVCALIFRAIQGRRADASQMLSFFGKV